MDALVQNENRDFKDLTASRYKRYIYFKQNNNSPPKPGTQDEAIQIILVPFAISIGFMFLWRFVICPMSKCHVLEDEETDMAVDKDEFKDGPFVRDPTEQSNGEHTDRNNRDAQVIQMDRNFSFAASVSRSEVRVKADVKRSEIYETAQDKQLDPEPRETPK